MTIFVKHIGSNQVEPQISGPEVPSVTNPTLDSSSSSSILRGTATGTVMEDEEDM